MREGGREEKKVEVGSEKKMKGAGGGEGQRRTLHSSDNTGLWPPFSRNIKRMPLDTSH